MRIDVITLFPELIAQCASYGVVGRACERGIVQLLAWNPRDYAVGTDRRVDDRPYGGGPGMVLLLEPLHACLADIRAAMSQSAPVIYFTPQGQPLDQPTVRQLAGHSRLIFVCGRYEGIDERFVNQHVDHEISLGDFVLSGGELAAAAVIDAVTRLQPGSLGHDESAQLESFEAPLGILDHPHYTRPAEHPWGDVPAVLRSGNHAAIARWRRQQALGRTYVRRPDLLARAELTDDDRLLLSDYLRDQRSQQQKPMKS